MIIYRPNRSTLYEAMQEATEFDNEESMKNYIVEEWKRIFDVPLFDISDIVISEEKVNDKRNGWKDTRHVCVKRMGNEDYIEKYGCAQCIGMCATEYR